MGDPAPTPRDWASPIEGELCEVIQSLDEAKLAIVAQLREQDPPGEELQRFSAQFDSARDGLEKLLLDAVSPETEDGTGETEPKTPSTSIRQNAMSTADGVVPAEQGRKPEPTEKRKARNFVAPHSEDLNLRGMSGTQLEAAADAVAMLLGLGENLGYWHKRHLDELMREITSEQLARQHLAQS